MDSNENTGAGREVAADERIRVGSTAEFEDVERTLVDVGGREVCVFNVDGEYHALANYCPHQGGPVCEGELTGTIAAKPDDGWALSYDREDQIVACPWHGWEFDITSGESLATGDFVVPRYEVVVEDGEIYIEA